MRLRIALLVVAAALISHWLATPAQSQKTDPFDFLRPTAELSADDRRQLDDRRIIVRILPASGQELATMAAASLNIGTDAFVEKVRNVVALKKGRYVPQMGKFSSPPTIADLQHLTLDDPDIDTIERCRPTRCSLKLNDGEIARLQRALVSGGRASKERVQQEFRQILLDRTTNYLASGALDTKTQFLALMQNSPLVMRTPQLANYLEHFPAATLAGSESFLYWSKETYTWKPMISLTHMTILRSGGEGPLPEVLVIGRDIFSTRYTGGSLVLTSLVRHPHAPANRGYLVYVNRTRVDGVKSLWRPLVEYRIKTQAKKVFAVVRDRFEGNGALSTQ